MANELPFLGATGAMRKDTATPPVGGRDFYFDAFGAEFMAIWGETKFSREIPHLCHVRAYTAFWNKEDQDIEARRRLLFWYLSRIFSIKDPDDTLRRMFSILPCDSSVVKRAIRNLCIAYNDGAVRKFTRDGQDLQPETAAIIARWYQRAKVDSTFQAAYRLAKLTNTVLIHVGQSEGTPVLNVYPADMFRVEPKKLNRYEAAEIWIPSVYGGALSFKKWTAPTPEQPYVVYELIDAATNEVRKTEVTAYKRLPFVTLRLDSNSSDFYGGGIWELIESQLKINKTEMAIDENVDYNAIGVWMATNVGIPKEKFKLTPGFILNVEDVVIMEGSPAPPTLEHINAQTHYSELSELQGHRERRALQNLGLPSSVTNNETASNLSGVAMLIDQKELIEARDEDLTVLRVAEQDLFSAIVEIMNADAASGVNPDGLEVAINYAEPKMFTDPAADFDFLNKKFAAGLITAKDYVVELTGNELISTDDEAVAYLQKNKQQFALIQNINDASPTI